MRVECPAGRALGRGMKSVVSRDGVGDFVGEQTVACVRADCAQGGGMSIFLLLGKLMLAMLAAVLLLVALL